MGVGNLRTNRDLPSEAVGNDLQQPLLTTPCQEFFCSVSADRDVDEEQGGHQEHNEKHASPHTPDTSLRRMATRGELAGVLSMSAMLFLVATFEFAYSIRNMSWRPGRSTSETYPRFLVLGDWGRDGQYNQTLVADAMARRATTIKPAFIISTGDNFYESGLVSVDDPQFDTSFKDIYHHDSLQVPWHVVLGNHDYGETIDEDEKPKCTPASKKSDQCYFSPLHQLDLRLSERDERWHCERSFSLQLANNDVEIFFIDTTPMIQTYYDKPWRFHHGGLLEQSWEGQLLELESKLARSKATWKLLVGHHPIHSHHREGGDYIEMIENLEPLVIKYGVQAYFSGHDHNLQHIVNSKTKYHQVISGAGSYVGKGFDGDKDSPFQYDSNGFVSVSMSKNTLKVEYWGLDSDDEALFSIDIPAESR